MMKNLDFPVISKIEIKNFSLYKKKNFIEIDVNDGVFCLAGANGLGKSTFINIVNYALTGIVRRPDSEFSQFNSIPQFYSKSKTFAASYFDRRVDENLRDVSSVTLQLKVGEIKFEITRGFFEQDALVELEIIYADNTKLDSTSLTSADLDRIYKEELTKAIGLTDFDQFVFLQIFVLTFDETHQLLFWDNNLMERVLYLFFNLDSSKAKLADQLRKDISTYESNMRNLQWDATQKEKELTNLLNQIELAADNQDKPDEKAIEDYQELAANLSEQLDYIQRIEAEVKECELSLSDYSLRNSALKNEYELLFNTNFNRDSSLEKDPAVIEILGRLKTAICSSADVNKSFDELKQLIWTTKCPNNLSQDNTAELEKLQELDEQIFKNSADQEKIQARKNRLLKEYEHHRDLANNIKSSMDDIEKSNENFLFSLYNKSGASEISVLITNMRSQIDMLLKSKVEETEKRNQKRTELKKLEKELNQQYLTAEETFLPVFIDYARNFLGLDINIYLQTYSKGATLILEVNDTERRQKHQLSESQRYFIDIALRMSLIEHSAKRALMLIDTPEGSLDIAYESRAGDMFANFTEKNYNLLLTANINSSMLLKKLATRCKAEHMKLERMTEWTFLSEVQQKEQAHIEAAFADIENLMK